MKKFCIALCCMAVVGAASAMPMPISLHGVSDAPAVLTIHLANATKYPYIGLSVNNRAVITEPSESDRVDVTLDNSAFSKLKLYGFAHVNANNTFKFYGCSDKSCADKKAATQTIDAVALTYATDSSYFNEKFVANPSDVTVTFN